MFFPAALLLASCSQFHVAVSSTLPQEPLLQDSMPLNGHDSNAENSIFAFHKNLTEIESITYNEQKCGEWLASSLEFQGYTVEKQWVDKDTGRFNVYAYPGDVRETKVLVSSHYDTVDCSPSRPSILIPSVLRQT